MRLHNQHLWKNFFDQTTQYIYKLKNISGTLMINTNRKTAFLGFLMAIQSVNALFTDFVVGSPDQPPRLKYLLTYKLSQDHLELFSGCVRSHLGCNNNPTCRQFVAAYKRLLVQNEIKPSKNANCTNLQLIPILTIDSSTIQHITHNTAGTQVTICQTLQQAVTERAEPMESKHD